MKIAVCDDEEVQRELIVKSIRTYFADRKIPICIQEYRSAEQLIFQYDLNSDIDIALLDIQMEGMDGIALAKYLRSKNEALSIIFITAMTEYIYEGFKVNAINYLLKPYEEEKLYDCINKAVEECMKQEEILIIRVDKEILKIRRNQILRVEGDGHYLKVVTGEQCYRIKKSMKEIEMELSDEYFLRINRSDILNLRGIERITTKEITLINGEKLLVPKGKHKEISEAFMNCHFRGGTISC
ncbi:LytR/AlgR family response regulator transcription factor [Anaeromicropila herbilytica]|uniref:Stage 0 sporulation protein A homolog n=1 Tax=Anaeromicropila herbilytica TaxID=2785025 RepID=A0A7R7EN16_9FIRM|nr:LytTR family DNA-binding domain-containing protein [Anaeromicropila herbilytica]BCN31839.1 DNA-binding response regulator [Anaeromicropila herbilytica]